MLTTTYLNGFLVTHWEGSSHFHQGFVACYFYCCNRDYLCQELANDTHIGHAETLIYDVLKVEWSVIAGPTSSITTNKTRSPTWWDFALSIWSGFGWIQPSACAAQRKGFPCCIWGTKKEPSNEVEVLIKEKNEVSISRRSTLNKGSELFLSENRSSSAGLASQLGNGAPQHPVESVVRQNLASAIEQHGSGRKSLSESSLVDPNPAPGNVSLRKQFHNEEEYNTAVKTLRSLEDECYSSQASEHRMKLFDTGIHGSLAGCKINVDEIPSVLDSENSNAYNQGNGNLLVDNDDEVFPESHGKSVAFSAPSSIYQLYETKMAALIRKNGILEGQLTAALASREAVEKNLSSVLKNRQEMEKKLADTLKEMEMLKEKLAGVELAQEEANNLSNIVHSDNVRLEHDVAFLKAVLDDTQKELHSTRGVLAGERQEHSNCSLTVVEHGSFINVQVEVFHLKQRLQSMENRAPTPRKPFHV
ncbi:hypothetical protein CK203_001500 [Vitis vinifera]|uniref:Uncharacterized protein n=1 Tax=Vitis vinifera TaxID=29760 RepID=A0A438KMC8_VITVI|nr:hypothetical protein CK203_001500 [Vitis vinifera]